jgi:hypothetical protein
MSEESPLKVSTNFPTQIRLQINGDKVKKKAGQKLATFIRARIRRGIDGDGTKLPIPEDGGSPLRDSRKMVNTIRYRKLPADKRRKGVKTKYNDVVAPSTSRRTDAQRGANSNFGIMSIHTAEPGYEDPMGQNDPHTIKVLADAATKEVARQLAKGEGGLKLELKKTLSSAKRSARRR